MSNNKSHRSSGRTNLASCIVATIFLIFLAMVILIVFFSVFKPKDPRIAVRAVQLTTFSIANGTVTFSFSQYSSVRNPNKAVFTHYDSTLQLLYSGNQVGFMFIPAGKIDAGRSKYMSATFKVESFPLTAGQSGVNGVSELHLGPILELESRLKMVGRVRVLHIFTHHVESSIDCKVSISISDGAVVGLHC